MGINTMYAKFYGLCLRAEERIIITMIIPKSKNPKKPSNIISFFGLECDNEHFSVLVRSNFTGFLQS